MKFRFSTFLRSSFCVQVTFKDLLLSLWLHFGVFDVLNGHFKAFSRSVRNGRVSAVEINVNKCGFKRISKCFSSSLKLKLKLNTFDKCLSHRVPLYCFRSIRCLRFCQDLHPKVVTDFISVAVSSDYLFNHCNPSLPCYLILEIASEIKVYANRHLNRHFNRYLNDFVLPFDDTNSFRTKIVSVSVSRSVHKGSEHDHRKIVLSRSGDIETNPGPLFQLPRTDVIEREADARQDWRQDAQDTNSRSKHVTSNQKHDLQVMSYNIRGLSDSKKVRHAVNNCYKLSKSSVNSFFMFQETFVTRLDILNYLWRGEYHLTPGLGNSQGCLTLVTAPYKIIQATNLHNRAHVLALTKDDTNNAELILVNVYAPNGFGDDKVRFFQELKDIVDDNVATYNCDNVIVAGDFNLVFSLDEVKNRLYTNVEQRVAASVKAMLQQINLVDSWELVPTKLFTWKTTRTGQEVFSTLDRIMFTQNWISLKTVTTDWSLSLSDHAAVTSFFQRVDKRCEGRSRIPRLDPRLLLDPEGRGQLDARFRELTAQASSAWNPHVKLEFFKMSLRTAVNEVNGNLKAALRDTEVGLNRDINELVNELAQENVQHERKLLLMTKLDDLRQLKRAVVDRVGTRLEQRTARKWYNEGELSNRYFFNLLNRKANDDINALYDENGVEVKDPKVIEDLITKFYKDLYESVPHQVEVNDEFFRHIQEVPPEQAKVMEEHLTLDELTNTLATCSDSSPGPDGIPYSYLKHYWAEFGPVILDAWRFSTASGQLPTSHKLSYLKLIPKTGKDVRVINNLRPITLSNTDHKLITKTYARKLTKIVGGHVGEEQTAYIPGRLINDNIRAMLTTIGLANLDDAVDGVVISLDAKKAFDSVDHRYIRDCLRAFGLSAFIPIFNILYKDLRSQIIINGKTIDGYSILKGVKQGDALSCVLFILCMEPLIRNIKGNENISRIESRLMPINIPKVYSFADDISVVTKNSNLGTQAIFTEYETFTKISGLQLNPDKTEILCFNKDKNCNQEFLITYEGARHRVKATDRIKINGILFTQDVDQLEDINVTSTIAAMERLLLSWSTRRLTLLGRILVIKTYAISKIIYVMQSLMLSERSYKAVIKVIFKFLWNKNLNAARAPERLKRNVMLTSVQNGGFGMVNVAELGSALNLKAYGRLLVTKHPFFEQVKGLLDANDFFNVRLNYPVDRKVKDGIDSLNKERRKILDWPLDLIIRDAKLCALFQNHKLKQLLTPIGRQSLNYFILNARTPNPCVGQLSTVDVRSIERNLKYQGLSRILTAIVNLQINVPVVPDLLDLIPTKGLAMVNVSSLSSKAIRLNQSAEQRIEIYKLCPTVDPIEVLAWTKRTKSLTSTRHKNILLRIIHGDVFSNSRLFRFGLLNDPKCINCPEPIESIAHRLKDCPKAEESWRLLGEAKLRLNLSPLTDGSIESLLGIKDNLDKLELALNAELLLKLSTRSEVYCPKALVKSVLKFISYAEKLGTEMKTKFDNLLRDWG